jgi:hypothetical protein
MTELAITTIERETDVGVRVEQLVMTTVFMGGTEGALQPYDENLTAIAAIAPTGAGALAMDAAGGWIKKSWLALASALGLPNYGIGSQVSPESYRALGDGTTDDTIAMQAAFATGNHVKLASGKVYLVSAGLVMSPDQKLRGNDATIRRVPQVTTTTTTAITSGVTNSITVAAGTGANFKVGQTIAGFNGVNYTTQNMIIDNIVGDVITTHTAFILSAGSPWSGSTTIALSFMVLTSASGSKIYDLEMDGNRANWPRYHWENTVEIHHSGIGVTIKNCYLHDLPGEGIMELTPGNWLGTGRKYLTNRIVNCNGNGIHLNGGSGTLIHGNTITDCSLDTYMGHVGGCITFSQANEDISILNNYFARARCGVGQISSNFSRKVLIQGNTFEAIQLTSNMVANGITTSYAVEVSASTKDGAVNDISVLGNKFYDCTPVIFLCSYTASTAKTITGITKATNAVVSSTAHGLLPTAYVRFAAVVGMTEINGLYGTVLSVNTNDFTVELDTTAFTAYSSGGTATGAYPTRFNCSGNTMFRCDKGAANTPAANSAIFVNGALTSVVGMNGLVIANNEITFKGNDILSSGIVLSNCGDAVATGNVVKYGQHGVQVIGGSGNVNVTGNTFSNQNMYGVYGGAAGGNVSINNNVINNDTTANGSYQGIALAGSGISCKGNMVNIVAGYMGIRINAVANCVVQGNTVRAPSTKCIKIETGSTGYVVTENQVTSAVVDTPAVGVRVANNDIIV